MYSLKKFNHLNENNYMLVKLNNNVKNNFLSSFLIGINNKFLKLDVSDLNESTSYYKNKLNDKIMKKFDEKKFNNRNKQHLKYLADLCKMNLVIFDLNNLDLKFSTDLNNIYKTVYLFKNDNKFHLLMKQNSNRMVSKLPLSIYQQFGGGWLSSSLTRFGSSRPKGGIIKSYSNRNKVVPLKRVKGEEQYNDNGIVNFLDKVFNPTIKLELYSIANYAPDAAPLIGVIPKEGDRPNPPPPPFFYLEKWDENKYSLIFVCKLYLAEGETQWKEMIILSDDPNETDHSYFNKIKDLNQDYMKKLHQFMYGPQDPGEDFIFALYNLITNINTDIDVIDHKNNTDIDDIYISSLLLNMNMDQIRVFSLKMKHKMIYALKIYQVILINREDLEIKIMEYFRSRQNGGFGSASPKLVGRAWLKLNGLSFGKYLENYVDGNGKLYTKNNAIISDPSINPIEFHLARADTKHDFKLKKQKGLLCQKIHEVYDKTTSVSHTLTSPWSSDSITTAGNYESTYMAPFIDDIVGVVYSRFPPTPSMNINTIYRSCEKNNGSGHKKLYRNRIMKVSAGTIKTQQNKNLRKILSDYNIKYCLYDQGTKAGLPSAAPAPGVLYTMAKVLDASPSSQKNPLKYPTTTNFKKIDDETHYNTIVAPYFEFLLSKFISPRSMKIEFKWANSNLSNLGDKKINIIITVLNGTVVKESENFLLNGDPNPKKFNDKIFSISSLHKHGIKHINTNSIPSYTPTTAAWNNKHPITKTLSYIKYCLQWTSVAPAQQLLYLYRVVVTFKLIGDRGQASMCKVISAIPGCNCMLVSGDNMIVSWAASHGINVITTLPNNKGGKKYIHFFSKDPPPPPIPNPGKTFQIVVP